MEKGRIFQKSLALMLVVCLVATNFIYAITSTVYALSNAGDQGLTIDAYFKGANDENEEKLSEKSANISEGEKLYISIGLTAGKLQDAKITIDNANFKIVADKVDSQYISSIDGNQIELSEINYNDGKSGTIELELPVVFEEKEEIETDYFSRESTVNLSGTYINGENQIQTEKTDEVTLTWTEDIETKYSIDVEKVINLEKSTLIEVGVSSVFTKNYFPKESETLKMSAPEIDGKLPTKYTLLVNGDKVKEENITEEKATEEEPAEEELDEKELDEDVPAEEGTTKEEVTISYTNNFKNDNKVTYNKKGDTYKIIYLYDKDAQLTDKDVIFEGTIQPKLFGRSESMDEKTLKVTVGEDKGTIASVTAKSLSKDVYKGYMYANSKETIFEEEYNMELSSVDEVKATLDLEESQLTTATNKSEEKEDTQESEETQNSNDSEDVDVSDVSIASDTSGEVEEDSTSSKDASNNEVSDKDDSDSDSSNGDVSEDDVLDDTEDEKTEDEKKYPSNSQIYYKEIKINKEKLDKVLGSEGKLKITTENKEESAEEQVADELEDEQAKESTTTIINSESKANEEGYVVVSFEEKEKYPETVKIEVEKAKEVGTLQILTTKAIEGNAEHSKEILKSINSVKTTASAYTDKDGQNKSTVEVSTELKDTITEATLTMEPNHLSTKDVNDVDFIATIKTGTMDTDLIKNPTIKITLPEEVKSVELETVSALFAEENLKVETQEVQDDNTIFVKFTGEQTEFENEFTQAIKITIPAKITLDDMATSRKANITMNYTNENSEEQDYKTETDVAIQAPDGLITKTKVDANFTEKGKGTQKFTFEIANNYSDEIKNLSIIGIIPETDESQEDFENSIKESFEATIQNNNGEESEDNKLDSKDIEIEYSSDLNNSNGWTSERGEGAKYYKVKNNNISLKAGDRIKGSFAIGIKEVLDDYRIAFTHGDEEQAEELKIDVTNSNADEFPSDDEGQGDEGQDDEEQGDEGQGDEEQGDEGQGDEGQGDEGIVDEKSELSVKMVAKSGDTEIHDGDTVYEGQVIRYTYTITNNSDKDIENVKLTANHEGANVFEYDSVEQQNTANPTEMLEFSSEIEMEDKSNKEENIEVLKPNEDATISYQVRVKENVEVVENTVNISAEDIENINEHSKYSVNEGKIKLELLTGYLTDEYSVSKGMVMRMQLNIVNISDKDEENIKLTLNIPKGFSFYDVTGISDNENLEILNQNDEEVTLNIKKIEVNSFETIMVLLKMEEENPENDVVYFNVNAELDNIKYISNDVHFKVRKYEKSMFSAEQTANITDEIVKTGDKLIYKFTIKNIGEIADNVIVSDTLPIGTVIKRVYYIKNSEEINIDDFKNNIIVKSIDIDKGETVEFFIETEVDESVTGRETIENYATIQGMNSENSIVTNKITHKLQANIKKDDEEEPGEDESSKNKPGESRPIETKPEENKPGEDEPGEDKPGEDKPGENKPGEDKPEEKKLSISGIAWIDANKNGVREKTENKLSGIKVAIANVETGKYIADSEGNRLEITTNENGEYKFENIEKGKYIVIFTYDNTKYRNTEYKANKATENTNSDIITSELSKTNSDIKYGLTDTLVLKDSSLENIDAGFIENEIFDLNINKYITKVTIENSSGTVVKQYNNQQLAKVEIDSKKLAGSKVTVEYTMEVKNEGEVAGYANEIVDYLPKDLTFDSETNKNWYLSTDGYLHTTALAKELIEPGKTAQVKLTLQKTMTNNNTGLTSNKAQITKMSNELSIQDKDSKSGNNANTSTAELIISIKTGTIITIGIITALIATITTGIVIYTKKKRGGKI